MCRSFRVICLSNVCFHNVKLCSHLMLLHPEVILSLFVSGTQKGHKFESSSHDCVLNIRTSFSLVSLTETIQQVKDHHSTVTGSQSACLAHRSHSTYSLWIQRSTWSMGWIYFYTMCRQCLCVTVIYCVCTERLIDTQLAEPYF